MLLAARLKELRERSGKSQADVALRLRVAQPTYSKVETGRSRPSRAIVKRLARVYGVSADTLLAGVSDAELSDAEAAAKKRQLEERRIARVEAIARARLRGQTVTGIAREQGISPQRIYALLKGVSLAQFLSAGADT